MNQPLKFFSHCDLDRSEWKQHDTSKCEILHESVSLILDLIDPIFDFISSHIIS